MSKRAIKELCYDLEKIYSFELIDKGYKITISRVHEKKEYWSMSGCGSEFIIEEYQMLEYLDNNYRLCLGNIIRIKDEAYG